METTLIILFTSLALATILNIIFKRFSISHILGYILTGTIITTAFNLNTQDGLHTLELIAEFGIVFLMFTIGLEMPIDRLKKMKELLFVNGFFQMAISSTIIFIVTKFIFNLDTVSSLIIALAFSLSSTAIVLTYLKQSKDIYTPYGEKATAILVFQDLAVIPILLLITFLSDNGSSMDIILYKTIAAAIAIIVFMFTIGRKLLNWFLEFATKSKLEELFLGSILSIVIGTSLLAHSLGFTYSLGAFIAGMIIAETKYHIKVESDIASYKDLLLGTFFFSVGTKIDVMFLLSKIHYVVLVFILIMLIKAIVVYFLIIRKSNKSDSIKSALALCQIGEFSFAVFALAASNNIIEEELSKFLILVTVLSMIVTPFIVNNIYKLASYFVVEFYESDKITPINKKDHIIICGYSMLGRIVAHQLKREGKPFVIISDNLKHVLLARKNGFMAYFGHLEKQPVMESLKVDEASCVIITFSDLTQKTLICESIRKFNENIKIVVKVDSLEEKRALKELNIDSFVHAHQEIASLLVKNSLD